MTLTTLRQIWAMSKIDGFIPYSSHTAKFLHKSRFVPLKKIHVVHNSIETDVLNNAYKKWKLAGEKKESQRIVFTGRLTERKRVDILLMAFSKVLLKYKNAKLDIIGDGSESEKLKELSKKLDISTNIFFMGFVDDNKLNKFYQSCDVYVCPSELEGYGLTVLEATVNGAPVIACKVGGIPEIIKDGINGLLIDKDNLKQLSQSICRILRDNNLRDEIKRNNIDYESRNWINTAEETQNLYISLME